MSVVTKLGLDLAEFSRGWNRAETIAATGAGAIGKAVHKKLGLQDAFKSFVGAIGIDVKTIADGLARLITSVSKDEEEALKKQEDLSERLAESNIKQMRSRLSEEKRYQLALIDRDKLMRQLAAQETKTTEGLNRARQIELELNEKSAEIQEYRAKQAEKAAVAIKKELDARVDLNEKAHDANLGKMSAVDRAKALRAEIEDIQGLISGGALGDNEEKWKQILEKRKGDLIKAEGDIDEEKAKRDELLIKRGRAVRDIDENRTDLANAVEDRGKLTLTELANIGRFSTGTSADVANQSEAARQVLDLQRQAEEARLGGRAEDAIALLAQADKLKGGLTALNSGERADPFAAYKKALSKSEEELADINKQLKGKFVNQ